MGKKLDLAIGVLNGAIGDYLSRTGNGLASQMTLVSAGLPVAPVRPSLASACANAGGRLVLLVHGLMCTETVWDFPEGGDYGAWLARDFGYTPLYVRYNSGLAIADNGAALTRLLDALVLAWPVPIEEILVLGYSMGGLVVRSACHLATVENSAWLPLIRRAIYVGTPHRGAPLERIGRVVAKLLSSVDDPYTQLVAELANLRSDGVKDLGDADLRHEDRARRVPALTLRDPRHPVPLLPQISHYLVAGALSHEPWVASLFGDALVPVPSATDGHADARGSVALPKEHVKIVSGVGHIGLAHHPEVWQHIHSWCEAFTGPLRGAQGGLR